MVDDLDFCDHKNSVSVWKMRDIYDAELLKGAYLDHRYPWHTHEEYSLGIVLAGGVYLQTRHTDGYATRGSFVLINSEELHRGRPHAGGWQCRTLHIHPALFQNVAQECYGLQRLPRFTSPVIEDPDLSRTLLRLHTLSETTGSSLERQSLITAMIARLLGFHAQNGNVDGATWNEPGAVRRAKQYLDANLSEKVTLDQLAIVAEMPAFRLMRAFRQAAGLTPHGYQLQARVKVAHGLLKSGVNLAEVAATSGFSDQPHFTRVYKTIMGATPGQYRRTN